MDDMLLIFRDIRQYIAPLKNVGADKSIRLKEEKLVVFNKLKANELVGF